jgi:hypothetical protein
MKRVVGGVVMLAVSVLSASDARADCGFWKGLACTWAFTTCAPAAVGGSQPYINCVNDLSNGYCTECVTNSQLDPQDKDPFGNGGDVSVQYGCGNGTCGLQSQSLTIQMNGIQLTSSSQTIVIGSTATVQAAVVDGNGQPLANQIVWFHVASGPDAGLDAKATSDSNGQATFSFSNTNGAGTDVVVAAFFDAASILHGSTSVSVNWGAQTQLVYTGDATQDFSDAAHLAAKLSTSAGPVAGATLQFTLNTQSCSGVTDATGTASCALVLNESAGGYAVNVTFAGTTSLMPSSTRSNFTVNLEQTQLAYTGAVLIANGGSAHLAARLTEDGVTPIAGRTVTLTLGSGAAAQSCAAGTDSTGLAQCNVASTQALGPGVAYANFGGDGFYKPATTSKATILFAFPASGSFVVGDSSASVGASVTFWGAQWSKQNTLSRGAAPAAFKGFANNLSNSSPICGGTWSASSGNSSPPPSSVPSYMAVIVSSAISQSGTVIYGDSPQLMIIKTAPGYAPDPSYAGTGTVVATLCP